jgi:hypothetical protein
MEESRVAVLIRIKRSLKARLVQLAEREHRSLNQQVEFILEHSLSDTSSKQPNEPQSRKRIKGSS